MDAVERVKPRVHAFGHVHFSHGARPLGETLYINAAICTDRYDARQRPIVVNLTKDGTILIEAKG